jgi:hydroxymethylpyrimidine pyrophosphatase-like HAD family hydrolase
MINWNSKVKIVLADVDDTIAKVYTPSTSGMIGGLTALLRDGVILFMITGGGLQSVMQRVVEQIEEPLRKNILIAPCSGAEVWGFDQNGHLKAEPYYSLYSKLTTEQKTKWREIVKDIVRDYQLNTVDTLPIAQFREKYGGQFKTVMMADRGPQITLEFVNSYDLEKTQAQELGVLNPDEKGKYNFRKLIREDAEQRIAKENLPLKIGLGGDFAFDFLIEGVSKGDALKYILENEHILHDLGLEIEDLHNPQNIEIWGDKFVNNAGDFQMYLGIPESVRKEVRAIDFRKSETQGLPEGFNIVLWDGEKEFSEGLEEYLVARTN